MIFGVTYKRSEFFDFFKFVTYKVIDVFVKTGEE